jgi:hypothetical protein
VLRALRKAGYWSGRVTTTGDNRIDSIPEPLAMRPNFAWSVGPAKMKEKYEELRQQTGSILYFWGHSYECANDGIKKLEEVLTAVENRQDAWYATLGELMVWKFAREQFRIEAAPSSAGGQAFTLKMPWLHPYLRQVPLSLTLPDGVTEVSWDGQKLPAVEGRVQVKW